MIQVLFVCLGNICRSPMAEGSFNKIVQEMGYSDKISCDSAGTSAYHIGDLPDERMRKTAKNYDIHLNHLARQLSKEDFRRFHYIAAMDGKNYQNIKLLEDSIQNSSFPSKVFMMRDFDPLKDHIDVPDPYYGGMNGFEEVYNILHRSNKQFLDFLIKEHKL